MEPNKEVEGFNNTVAIMGLCVTALVALVAYAGIKNLSFAQVAPWAGGVVIVAGMLVASLMHKKKFANLSEEAKQTIHKQNSRNHLFIILGLTVSALAGSQDLRLGLIVIALWVIVYLVYKKEHGQP